MKAIISTLLIILTLIPVNAINNNKQKVIYAIQHMEAGNIDESITILEEVLSEEPDNYFASYELGLAYYMKENYDKATKLYKKLCEHPSADGQTYQMYGNSLEKLGKEKEAIKAYDKGIKKFPDFGLLYVERGMMELPKDYDKAIHYFEQGIYNDPTEYINYYRAAQIYLASSESAYGTVYAEIMLHLNPTEIRATEICKSLFDCFNSNITKEGDEINITFSKNLTVTALENGAKVPFGLMFKLFISKAIPVIITEPMPLNLKSFHKLRDSFLNSMYDTETGNFGELMNNCLYNYLRKVQEAGFLEAYDMTIFHYANPEESNAWIQENIEQTEKFIEWYKKNPLELTKENVFVRGINSDLIMTATPQ